MLHFVGIACVVAYIIATILYISKASTGYLRAGQNALWFAAGFHLLTITIDFFYGQSRQLGSAHTLSLVSFALVMAFLLSQKKLKIEALGIFIAPLALSFFAFSSIVFHSPKTEYQISEFKYLLIFHLFSALSALAILSFAFVLSVSIIFVERMLKQKRLTKILQMLPPLTSLDAACARVTRLGFILMLAGAFSGLILSIISDIPAYYTDPRLIWTFITVLLYAVVLISRKNYGMRGSSAAWLSIVAYLTIISSLVSLNILGPEGSFHVY